MRQRGAHAGVHGGYGGGKEDEDDREYEYGHDEPIGRSHRRRQRRYSDVLREGASRPFLHDFRVGLFLVPAFLVTVMMAGKPCVAATRDDVAPAPATSPCSRAA